jgi:hypothetical protein
MYCHKRRFAPGRASHLSIRLVSIAVILVPSSGSLLHGDIVRNDVKAYYGRVQSVGPQGVTLLTGCSGSAVQVIPLTDLNEVDFVPQRSVPRLTSSSSPSTAACNGPHGMLFTVAAKNGPNKLYLVGKSLAVRDGNAFLTLRDGTEIVAPSDAIDRFYYRDECFRFLQPDPSWSPVFKPKTP